MGKIRADYVPAELKKSENLNVRLTRSEYAEFKAIARKKNMTLSGTARELIVESLEKTAGESA